MSQIRQDKVLLALEECAPGFAISETVHHNWIRFNSNEFPLPKGAHGRSNPEIHLFQVRKMSRTLGIEDCMKGLIPSYRN